MVHIRARYDPLLVTLTVDGETIETTPEPGLLTQVIRDDGGLNLTTTYRDFDAQGHAMTAIYPGSDNVVRYRYDLLGRAISETNAADVTTLYEYDGRGNLLRRTTGDGAQARVTEYGYDGQGRLLREWTDADGLLVSTNYAYDINGKMASQTDGEGNTTTYLYDAADQLIHVIDPQGRVFTTTYTLNGQVETVTDAEGSATRNVYDGLGRATVNAYDALGRRASVTDAEGNVTRYEYDGLGNQIQIHQTEKAPCSGSESSFRFWARLTVAIAGWSAISMRKISPFNQGIDKARWLTQAR